MLAMTQQLQKNRERFFAETAATSLGKTWDLGPDREGPDFLVTEGTQQFGLEVCEIFTGPQGGGGSTMKRAESHIAKAIDRVRCDYEKIANVPLRVQLVCVNLTAQHLATVVPALLAEDFPSKPVCHHVVLDQGDGLRIHATKALRPDWFSVNNRVGWVDRSPMPSIDAAVREKSTKLPHYRQAVGTDVRLLVVADRIHNSGKLTLEDPVSLNLHGFEIVYFYPYPESVVVFCD
jgi:hypothetical protein